MDKDRFRRRSDYSAPQRRPVSTPPVVDGIDQARPQTVPIQPVAQPTQPIASTPVAAPPRPLSEQNQPQRQWTPPTGAQSTAAVAPDAITEAPKTIAVNISLPKLRKPKIKSPRLSKKVMLIAGGVLLTLLLIIGGIFASTKLIHKAPQAAVNGAGAQAKVATSPSYEPVVPKTKTELASTNTAGTGFDGTRDTYSYQDTMAGLAFTVSQQPLPSGSASPQAAIDKIAKAIGGTTTVKVPNGTKGYISGDVKSGNQVIVFTVHNLLVFIQSPFSHPPADWELYIATLK